MQDLTPEQIAQAEEAMKAHRHEMKRVVDFINEPYKDKKGNEKHMNMHMRTQYIAAALDELHERVKNSISLHAYQMHQALNQLFKRVEKLEGSAYNSTKQEQSNDRPNK